ncbi:MULTISPECIES: AMP-binding protein [Vibrio]|uniref:non-ribosomal peptide synthetase n=1 Tax=Vibrio TaxID=662 RepID=UPI001E57CF1A|nr:MULTISPECIES: AMP-binding protein [Vibrio]MCC4891414.1 AMP-binding protein [Vibrio sp. F13]MCW4446217.1 AMP-binding protein [Vibrio splendidus]
MSSNIVLKKILHQSQLSPDAVAIKQGSKSIRYVDLICHAQELSSELLEAGLSPRTIVPIISQGGIDYVISLLAVWMTGGAFVPLDVDTPKARMAKMLKTIDSEIVIATTKQYACQTSIYYDHTVNLPTQNITFELPEPGAISYGFFTSGTTGEPKCCLNQHAGLANRFDVMSKAFQLELGDAVLQNSKHTFDSSLWQLLWPLTTGGKVVIPMREGILDIQATLDTIREEQIVMADFVPSVLGVYLQYMASRARGSDYFKSFRNILVGGEEVSLKLIKTIRLLCPWIQVTNTYGPTEASIGFVFHHFNGNEENSVPLGLPIANTSYVVLDDQLNEINKPGVLGQIAVLGVGLGLGYLGLPELTTLKFRSIRRSSGDYEPCYLTGDIGSLENGVLFFHGREDSQVQLNGVRLELTEIEMALEAIPSISCAKVAVDENANSKQILAVVTGSSAVDEKDVRQTLSESLPSEFIPQRIVKVDDFPRNNNGKIERASLLKLFKDTEAECSLIPELVNILSNYCVSSDIAPEKSFEELGIDSINLLCIAIDIEKQLGKRISSKDIASILTISELESSVTSSSTKEFRTNIEMYSGPVSHLSFTESVFISGASGYFGVHLLCELLVESSHKATCLVRASSDENAKLRLIDCAKQYKIENQIDWKRVTVVAGDITQDKMGLSSERYDQLALHTSHILHTAAVVNLNKSSEALRLTNAEGVTEVCKFALRANARKFHYVSSLAVEKLINNNSSAEVSGYAQTKFEGEKRVTELTKFNIEVSISRVGELMPSDKYKVPNSNSLLVSSLRVFKSLNQLVINHGNVSYTPIDVACSAIVSIFNSKLEISYPPQILALYPSKKVDFRYLLESLLPSQVSIQYKEPQNIIDQIITKSSVSTLEKHDILILDALMSANENEQWHLFDKSSEHLEPRKSAHYWPLIDNDYLHRNLKEI